MYCDYDYDDVALAAGYFSCLISVAQSFCVKELDDPIWILSLRDVLSLPTTWLLLI